MYILKIFTFQHLLFLIFPQPNQNPSPRTGPHDLLVTHYDCEGNEQKTLHKYALNQVTQCESEPQAIETTNVIQILRRDNLTLEFEITLKLNNIVYHSLSLAPPNITAQPLPHPFATTEVIYKYDRYTKKKIGYITFYNPYSGLSYTCIF